MESVKLGAATKSVFSAMAAGCLAVLALSGPARADDLQNAVSILQNMTDEQIRTELQRRSAKRHASPPAAAPITGDGAGGGSVSRSFRSIVPPLDAIDDATMAEAFQIRTRAIYGADDRQEWWQVKDENIRRLARATVAIFRTDKTKAMSSGVRLKTSTLGEDFGLCPGQLFSAQSTGASCSGTLVRPDVVLTARHCVGEKESLQPPSVEKLSFVFGFRVEKAGDTGTTDLPAEQIFAGKALLGRGKDKDNDWALVQLDRPVPSSLAEPVATWSKTPIAKGDKVFVIGYPSGLPMKYAPNGTVLDTSPPTYFLATLDTFHGNSGSGVFSEGKNELVGILVRGEQDYVTDKRGCKKVFPCGSECKGEGVTRITLVPTP